MDISVVIPVYNSEKTITDVAEGIIKVLSSKYEFEIILVNDDSKDDSLETCKKICLQHDFVKLVSLARNFGQHNALMAGFNHASGNYIICMDDDMQNPPEEITKLINVIENGNYDVVYAKYDELKESLPRRIGSKVNDFMANKLIDKPKDLYMTSFFILRSFVKDEIIKYKGSYSYIGGLVLRITKNIGTADIHHEKRKAGKSNYNIRKLLQLWVNGFTGFSVMPLRMATVAGGIFSVASFVYMICIIFRKLQYPNISVGWTSVMAAIMFFGGLQLCFIGIIGEYIGRIFLSINNKPQYVVKEKINLQACNKEKMNLHAKEM